MVSLHSLHGFSILLILMLFLFPQLLVSLLQISDVQVFLTLDFFILSLKPLFALFQLQLDLFLGQSEIIFKLLLSLLPILHLAPLYHYYISQFEIHHSTPLILILTLVSYYLYIVDIRGKSFQSFIFHIEMLLTNPKRKYGPISASRE
jgi:hypothetical protein